MEAFVAAADRIVGAGIDRSGIPLSESLRAYLALTLARFMREMPGLDRLTVRLVEAAERRDGAAAYRRLGDECLIATSLFAPRLRRSGGSLRHYMGLGQSAYDAADLTEQAWSFAHMRDVVVAATANRPGGLREAIDAARAGSPLARAELEEQGVLTFPARRWLS